MNLNIDKWKEFEFKNLIDKIYKAKAYNKDELLYNELYRKNLIPHVTRTELNNSVDCFVDYSEIDRIEEGNAITIGDTTATITYQKDSFITGDHMVVIRAKWLNEYTGLFIVTLLKQEKFRYSYGRAYIMESIKNTKILLPVNTDGKPDWSFIELYIKSLNYKRLTTRNINKSEEIDTAYWKEYEIREIFDVKLSSGDLKADDCDEGSIPLVSSGENDNGIVKYINQNGDGKAQIFKGNKITVDMFCHAFYQKDDFYAVSHGRVNILIPKFKMNKYIGIFIVTIINKEIYKYSYGRAVYSNVINNMKIKLPSDKEGQINLKFMEDYIKSLPFGDRV